jgi:hypothetical protein
MELEVKATPFCHKTNEKTFIYLFFDLKNEFQKFSIKIYDLFEVKFAIKCRNYLECTNVLLFGLDCPPQFAQFQVLFGQLILQSLDLHYVLCSEMGTVKKGRKPVCLTLTLWIFAAVQNRFDRLKRFTKNKMEIKLMS